MCVCGMLKWDELPGKKFMSGVFFGDSAGPMAGLVYDVVGRVIE